MSRVLPVRAGGGAFALLLLLLGLVAALGEPVAAWGWALSSRDVDFASALLPPLSGAHLLGTDELGRDVAVRLMSGARVSLFVGLCAATAAGLAGTLVGMVAGYFGGWVDAVLMRTTDAMLSLPVLPLLMVLSALQTGWWREWAVGCGQTIIDVLQMTLLLACLGWTGVARLVRVATRQVRRMDYVAAAQLMGASHTYILRRHILPNVLPPALVATTLEVGTNILYESALSFLGLGIKPPAPSWGNMLTHAQDNLYTAPWLAFWPGLCIMVTVVGINRLGDALRDVMDPHLDKEKP